MDGNEKHAPLGASGCDSYLAAPAAFGNLQAARQMACAAHSLFALTIFLARLYSEVLWFR
jgi:hypothetical protein